MTNMWKKKVVEQGYNYLDGAIQSMAEFLETKIENLERFDNKKNSNKEKKKVQQEKETF